MGPGSRSARAGTTAGSVSSTNLRLCEMMAGAASLFPACYLQGMVQLQRVGSPGADVAPSVVTIRHHNVFWILNAGAPHAHGTFTSTTRAEASMSAPSLR